MSVKPAGCRIVVLGLSLSSSWGNGHATTYRALIKGLAERGHRVLFLERDVPWYASRRDLAQPDYCELKLYADLEHLETFEREIARADAVIVGSYVPEGIAVIDRVLATARGTTVFYDIDTPVTLAAVEAGACAYLAARQIPCLDLYLSFTGGPLLRRIEDGLGARAAAALYCSADADSYRPLRRRRRWDLGYLGTYSADRQPALERLLLAPARLRPDLRFVVAGAQYPSAIRWPPNVTRIEHLSPAEHPGFYASLRWTLNITRADMVRAGYSPSVRLFEAAACGTPIISDDWPGIDTLFRRGRDILVADGADAVLEALTLAEAHRQTIARNARERFLARHTARVRSRELERLLLAPRGRRPVAGSDRGRSSASRNRSEPITFPSER